jgi:hypothetical protein
MSKRPLPKRPHFYQSAPTFYQDATVFFTKRPPLFFRISYFTKTLPLFYCQNGTFNNFFLKRWRLGKKWGRFGKNGGVLVGGVLTCIPKDHSTKGWLQLAQWFLRRRFKCESLRRTTDGRRTPSDGKRPGELKGCIRLTVASDKVYQLLTHGRWFCSGFLHH